jgi:hypothetical protein
MKKLQKFLGVRKPRGQLSDVGGSGDLGQCPCSLTEPRSADAQSAAVQAAPIRNDAGYMGAGMITATST